MNIKPCCGCPDGQEYIYFGCDCHNTEEDNMKEISDYIQEAREFYDKNHTNYIPDAEDIADCVCDFIEDDSGCEVNDDMYFTILKQVRGGK